MTARKRHRKQFPLLVVLAIFAIVAVNGYALHELAVVSRTWKVNFLPGSISTQLMHLVIILGLNSTALIYLLIDRSAR